MRTVYVHPGYNSCRVYVMPYKCDPRHIPHDRQQEWKEIAMLNHELKIRYISTDYAQYRDYIEGSMGTTYFYIDDEGKVTYG